MQQVWKPVNGYEAFYEVSSQGAVRGLDRVISLPNNRKRRIRGNEIKLKRSKDGYLFVSLSKDGKAKTCYIHRLVATAFLPNPLSLPEVNHLSGDKQDNSAGNLQWVTHSENMLHAFSTGLCKNIGGNHPFAAGVIDHTLGKEFATTKEWCEARGISYSTGRNILNGQKSRTIDLQGVYKTKTGE